MLANLQADQPLDQIELAYDDSAADLRAIPLLSNAGELSRWAERRERSVYAQLDLVSRDSADAIQDLRLDGLLWLQSVRFSYQGKTLAPKRLLMIDDLHRLRRSQRAMLIGEMTELRPSIPVWLAERNIALGDELLLAAARKRA